MHSPGVSSSFQQQLLPDIFDLYPLHMYSPGVSSSFPQQLLPDIFDLYPLHMYSPGVGSSFLQQIKTIIVNKIFYKSSNTPL